jgi:PAS domain S-box-containing protein
MARRTPLLGVTLATLAVLVAMVAVLGMWQVIAARNSQRAQIGNGELTAARLASSAVANAVTSRLDTLDNLADLSGSASFLATNSPQVISATVGELLKLYPEFSSMSIVGAHGAVLANQPPWTASPGAQAARQQAYAGAERSGRAFVSDSFSPPTGGLAVELAVPVRNGPTGPLVGIVEATLPASTLSAAMGGTALQGGGSLVIIDRTGQALTGPAAVSSEDRSYAATPAVKQALAGHLGTATGALPGFAGSRLVAFAPVKSLRWAVVVQDPTSVLNGPVAALTGRLAAIGALVVILALGTAVLLWRLLRQLARQRDEATAVFGSVGEGVATVDADGKVLKINPALERMVGKPSALVEHQPWESTFVLCDERAMALAWEDTVVAEAIQRRRVVASRGYALGLETADGRRLPVAVTAAPLVVDAATPTGAVVVLRDVAREREVDQLKSSLVSTVSHELRTPLTLIQGFSELLLARPDLGPDRSRDALHEIHVSSQRLGRLIDDLLSVSRIESGRLTADFETFDLSGVISEVLASFSTVSDHHFATDVHLEMRPVLADRDKTVQVLTNLLSNAVKYSPEGSEVRIVARSVDNHVEVQIIDQGIGMTESERAAVFEKFSRSNRPEVRKVGGTGLGLYITKNLVEMQGGQLWLRSDQGEGTTVSFTVPLAGSMSHVATAAVSEMPAQDRETGADRADAIVRQNQ